ncbi:hypothetical protein ACFYP4_22070 [Streptomyces sp. NPDC005551]|uniref:hypothetical protein n=1 Tax=unclassified Streptomyces TaxID=2593676 RepID=UPI00340CEA75
MATKNDHPIPLRAMRQLRRIRMFYAAGALLWAVLAVWLGREHPGSRQMWVSVLFVAVFAGLLSVTSLWLWRQGTQRASANGRHAGARGMAAGRHASA